MAYRENPEKDQDRVFDTYDHFKRWGYVMFPENMKTYQNIAKRVRGRVLEAGCGMGLGTNIIAHKLGASNVVATDKLINNIKFARALYPMIEFDVWDLNGNPWKEKFDFVVCIEAIEHVANYKTAIRNLIDSAEKEVWISTPNGARTEEHCPSNEFHVKEFTPHEMLEMIGNYKTQIFDLDMNLVEKSTKRHPLIYRIIL